MVFSILVKKTKRKKRYLNKMEISIKYQLISTMYSIILGFFTGLIYDWMKILRKLLIGEISRKTQQKILKIKFPLINLKFNDLSLNFRKKSVYFIFDMLFFIILTPIMLIFTYAVSNGTLRWYIIIGAFIGFLCYYYSISKIVLFVYEYILVILKIVVSYVIYFAKIPLTKINLKIKRKLNSFKMKKKSKKEKKPTEEKAKNRQIILYGFKK